MSYILTVFGLLLMLFRELDISPTQKMILFAVAICLFILAKAIDSQNIHEKEIQFRKLEKNVEELKKEGRNNE